ncbi:polyprenyl synthetase family protein [Paenibacillus camelliae]|uniref:polyprenyl synthetase family protein n=1 Tax=Paenibacillus camelliae TaxID=512410 RepID=UPI00203BE8BB|nr:farnesyl diphosphate synthase [Paenibacillus camelliae]MCM3633162.1 polyprenyl synthetase family protein [Paenibacillus camelliae]
MNHSLSINEHVQQVAAEITEELKRSLSSYDAAPSKLIESMEYSLTAGGKRLRPYLVMAAAYAVHADETTVEKAIAPACAVEYIHTYSLIHDDLPAMDNDDLRRGKPTNHKVFGEAMAILAGDALLTGAFGIITSLAKEGKLDPLVAVEIIDDLSRYAGALGMVGGQVADMEAEQGITSIEQLEYIHEHKTSDLVVFSVLAGARIAGANAHQLQQLELYGRNIGMAFQIQDDVLDLVGDEQKLGKRVQSDVAGEKVTFPFLLGLEESKALVVKLTEEAKAAVLAADLAFPDQLLELADYLVNRES